MVHVLQTTWTASSGVILPFLALAPSTRRATLLPTILATPRTPLALMATARPFLPNVALFLRVLPSFLFAVPTAVAPAPRRAQL